MGTNKSKTDESDSNETITFSVEISNEELDIDSIEDLESGTVHIRSETFQRFLNLLEEMEQQLETEKKGVPGSKRDRYNM